MQRARFEANGITKILQLMDKDENIFAVKKLTAGQVTCFIFIFCICSMWILCESILFLSKFCDLSPKNPNKNRMFQNLVLTILRNS